MRSGGSPRYIDGEHRVAKTELVEKIEGLGGEQLSGSPTSLGEALAGLETPRDRGVYVGCDRLRTGCERGEAFRTLGRAHAEGDDLVDGGAVLPLQVGDRGRPFLHRAKYVWVVLDRFGHCTDVAGHLVDLDDGGLEPHDERIERLVEVACGSKTIEGQAQAVLGAVLIVDRGSGDGGGFDDLCGVAHPRQCRSKLHVLTGCQVGSVDLAGLVSGEVELARQRPGVA